MYVLMEPLRQDYGNVSILEDVSEVDKLDSKQNYLILPKKGGGTEEVTLVLRTYKTAKKYGEFKRLIPSPLVNIIRASMEEHPREYLFVDSRKNPFLKRNSFIKWSNRCLETAFEGRRVTVNTLRHSYISSLDFNTRTPGELMRTSKMMGHSMGMQQLYRRIPDSEETGQKTTETCSDKSSADKHTPPKVHVQNAHTPTAVSAPPPKKKNTGGIVVISPPAHGGSHVSPRVAEPTPVRRGGAVENQVTIRF